MTSSGRRPGCRGSSFEWLWRLAQEPARLWRRYLVEDFGGLPVFVGMVLRRLTGRPLTESDVSTDHGHRARAAGPAVLRTLPSTAVGSPVPLAGTEPIGQLAS